MDQDAVDRNTILAKGISLKATFIIILRLCKLARQMIWPSDIISSI